MSAIRPMRGLPGGRRSSGSRRLAMALTTALASLALVAGPGVRAQDEAGEAFCALFTPAEIEAAFATEVEAIPDYGRCDWEATDFDSELESLNASWSDQSIAAWQSVSASWEELTVGGRPAGYDTYTSDVPVGDLFIDVDPGVLWLEAAVAPEVDPRDALVRLGELAVGRTAALPAPPEPAAPEPASSPEPPATADPVAAAFCALFTPQEVGDILGTDVGAKPQATGCMWSAVTSEEFTSATAAWTDTSLAEQKANWPDGTDTAIGGRPAYYSPGFILNELLIELDAGVLWLVVTGYGGDVEAALTALGELAVPRSGALPPASQPEPVPSIGPDEGLAALFPASIGGEPVNVSPPYTGASIVEVFGSLGTALESAVTAQGGSLDDVTAAFAFTPDGQGAITVFKLGGLDAAAALAAALEGMGADGEMTEVAGRTVTAVGPEEGPRAYFLAGGDIIWAVQAQEPALSEVIGALP